MEIRYFPDTDSLYIALTPKASVDSEEIAPGFVVDYDEEGRVVGIDIDSRARAERHQIDRAGRASAKMAKARPVLAHRLGSGRVRCSQHLARPF